MRTRKGKVALFFNNLKMYLTDPYYRAHFGEIIYHVWKQFLCSKKFDFLVSKNKKQERECDRVFWVMNDPRSSTRQLADWKSLGPKNPPPRVRESIGAMREVLNDLDMRERHGKILSKGDN